MIDQPVSVIIPTYNRSGLVDRAIASAVAAISAGDEVIVVDDGSTDGTAEVVARQRGAVRYIQTPHGGVSAARNRGIREARTLSWRSSTPTTRGSPTSSPCSDP